MSYLRILGRPKIERDTNGLRKITRRYVVQGDISEKATIESEVFLPMGTADVEFDATTTQDLKNVQIAGALADEVDREDRTAEGTGAYLVQQSIDPGQNINEVILTRVYQELDNSSEPVQVGGDEIQVTGEDRLSLKRTYIVKNPYAQHYQTGRVGVDFVMVPDGSANGAKCILGTVQSKETEVFTEFIEQYYEDGVLSEKVDYLHGQYPNHKLEIRTLRGVAKPQTPDPTEGPGPTGPWFETENSEGPGNADYGQVGKTVWTVKYAKGYGLISEKSEVKGKPPNTVEVKTIQFLTGENGTVPSSAIPSFTRQTFVSMDEKDGYELHTIRGVDVSNATGVVDATVAYKHGDEGTHKLEVIQSISYGQAATIQNVVDFVYPSGDPHTSLGNFVIISESEDTKGEFDVFKNTIVRGDGLIGESTKKVGLTEVTEQVYLRATGTTIGTTLAANELSRKVDQKDGYEVVTITVTTALTGLVDDKTDTKHNGALLIKTRTQLGSAWDPANVPTNYTLISERNHQFQTFPAITRVYAKGTGEISRGVRKVGQAEVTEITTLYLSTATVPTTLQTNELKRDVSEQDGYIIERVSITTSQSGLIDSKTDTRNNGALVIYTLTQIGSTWDSANTPAQGTLISERDHTYDIYSAITRVYAHGSGQILESTREEKTYQIETYVILGTANPPADAFDIQVTEEDGYQKTRYSSRSTHTPAVQDTNFRISQGVKYTTISELDLDHTTAEVSGSKSYLSKDDFIGEKTDVQVDSWDEQSWLPAKAFVKKHSVTTVTSTPPAAPAVGDFVSYNQVAPDIWHKTTNTFSQDFNGNSVVLSETTVHRAGYYLVTTVTLGQKHVGGGDVVEESEQTDQYGITTYSVTEAFAVADSYTIYKTHAFTVPGNVSTSEHGVVETPPYTVMWPCEIDVEYSTTPASYTTYVPPVATAAMHVRFYDGSDDVLEKGGGSNYTYSNGLTINWATAANAEFMGRSIRSGSATYTGMPASAWSNSGNCLGSSSREVLSISGFKIFRNEKITTM